MPGKPAPLPRSTQIRASGARSRSWSEVGDVPGPELRDRVPPDQIGVRVPGQQEFDELIEAGECFT